MKRFKRFTALTLILTIMLGSAMTVNAKPQSMPDGQTFDAEYYAQNNPDVVAALGNSEKALYAHYQNYGKKEGRKPYEGWTKPDIDVTWSTDYEEIGKNQYLQHPLQIQVLTPGAELTAEDVILIAKEVAPNGTTWDMCDFYDTLADVKGKNVAKRQQGCGSFAFWLQDAIFGSAPVTRYENTEGNMMLNNGTFEFCMYDIVCYTTPQGSFHGGVVIGADPSTQTLYLAEGNVNGVVNWNRTLKVDDSDGNKIARVYRRG